LGILDPETILATDELSCALPVFRPARAVTCVILRTGDTVVSSNWSNYPALDDEAVIAALTTVKGIGRGWTAEIYLMFALERLDVLPAADLGLRDAVRLVYDRPRLPTSAEVRLLGRTLATVPQHCVLVSLASTPYYIARLSNITLYRGYEYGMMSNKK
jgi:DNA-3-methyladenine glycosylase II